MKKIKITLEIHSEDRNKRRTSKLEKLFNAFLRFWKAILVRDLSPRTKAKLLQLIVISSTILALTYLLFRILTVILNHL